VVVKYAPSEGENTNVIQKARIRKTKYFFDDREAFMDDLVGDIMKAVNYARRKGLIPVFRLNGTSDLSWEKYPTRYGAKNIFDQFPTLQFYDYTKVLGRKVADIPNYHLTFSAADGNDADVARALAAGMNVTVVYDKIPQGVLDPKVGIIGLKAKGRAKKDTSGFVRRVVDIQPV